MNQVHQDGTGSDLSIEDTATALLKLKPKEALEIIYAMTKERGDEVISKIFDRNFHFYADMMGEQIVKAWHHKAKQH